MSDDLVTFLRARLEEDEARYRETAGDERHQRWALHESPDLNEGYIAAEALRALREIEVWRRILLEYAIPPGTDAVDGCTERETGFRLALSLVLKAKAATYSDHPDYAKVLPPSVSSPGASSSRMAASTV